MFNKPLSSCQLELCLNSSTSTDVYDEILIGRFTRISFNRTLRIPEDGKDYPLPAGLGRFPIHRVEDYADKVPSEWLKEGGFFIPLYQKEALFIEFHGVEWHPTIAKVNVGKINAITGKTYSENLSSLEQDYLVIPDQKWLDGIASGQGTVKQFVAMPLGQGYTIEAQITDEEKFGGFQIVGYQAKEGRFPERDPAVDERIRQEEENRKNWSAGLLLSSPTFSLSALQKSQLPSENLSMGIAAGGSIKQQILPDIHGVDIWDRNKKRSITIHLVNSQAYKMITGKEAPPSPVTLEQYKKAKIPWYSHYDESIVPVKPPSVFKRILSIAALDAKRGKKSGQARQSVKITPELIQTIQTPSAMQSCDTHRKRAQENLASKRVKEALRHINYVIDLGVFVQADDYLLRGLCNFHMSNFNDAVIDSTLAISNKHNGLDALILRAHCRKEMKDVDGLLDDAAILMSHSETEVMGLEFKVDASILAGNFSNAIYEALYLKKKYPQSQRADEILNLARDENYKQIRSKQEQGN